MDLTKYLTVLVMLCLEGGETGGGGKHHDHVRLHIPEFIHHDHHKKVITIHHHHHKPKKEHHHHHHHHKPQIPHGHHYHHHHKKVQTKSHTESKGGHHHGHHHAKHGHHHAKHGHHHGHYGHHGHHGHHGHGHHDAPVVPSFTYTPSSAPSYEDDYSSSFSPSVPAYGGGVSSHDFSAPQTPHVHGVTHTVKQVKVFDSLPGALPTNKGISHGYEVTEEGEEDDDVFTTVNQLQNRFPATFGYVRSAAAEPTNDPYSGLATQDAIPTHFAAAPEPTSVLSGGIESFTGTVQSEPFSSVPTQSISLPSVQPSADFPVTFQGEGFDSQLNSFAGTDGNDGSFLSNEENTLSDDTPVSFAREAGIQQTTKTGNVETVVY